MKKKFILPLGLLFAIATLKGADVPRPEYPRPQFERAEWVNLNGTWSFDFDFSKSGMERSLFNSKGLEKSITVPFCPESSLSGIGYTDFIPAVWYQRTLSVPTFEMMLSIIFAISVYRCYKCVELVQVIGLSRFRAHDTFIDDVVLRVVLAFFESHPLFVGYRVFERPGVFCLNLFPQ